jgi:hypothetical protein
MSVGLHIGEWYPDAFITPPPVKLLRCVCVSVHLLVGQTDNTNRVVVNPTLRRLRSGVEMFSPGGEYFAALYCNQFFLSIRSYRFFTARFSKRKTEAGEFSDAQVRIQARNFERATLVPWITYGGALDYLRCAREGPSGAQVPSLKYLASISLHNPFSSYYFARRNKAKSLLLLSSLPPAASKI